MTMRMWSCALLVSSLPALAVGSELMTEGKLAADLGDHAAAQQAFAALAADPGTPEAARAEALIRLAVAQRALGKHAASADAFRKAMKSPARDAQITRLLAVAVSGVAPDRQRWASEWRKVRLTTRAGDGAEPRVSLEWPGGGVRGLQQAFPASTPVTFDLEDYSLPMFIHHFLSGAPRRRDSRRPDPSWPESYQPPASVGGLNYVLHAGVQGSVTLKVTGAAWNEVLENVLASHGLGFVLRNGLLWIARVEDLDAIERLHRGTYGANTVNLDFANGDLADVLRLFSDVLGLKIVPAPGIAPLRPRGTTAPGTVTIRVSETPAWKALDLVLIANSLAATTLEEPGHAGLRIVRLSDVGGEPLDLSQRPAAAPEPRNSKRGDGEISVQCRISSAGELLEAKVVQGGAAEWEREALAWVKQHASFPRRLANGAPAEYTTTVDFHYQAGATPRVNFRD